MARPVRRDLVRSTADGACYCLMLGLGESSIPLFALAAGHGAVHAGLLTTVPPLLAGTAQLVVPRLARRAGRPRSWIVAFAVMQALAFLPLALMALTGRVPIVALYAACVVYWFGALAAGSIWTGWIGALVPGRLRAAYFARRSRVCHLCTALGLVAAGLALDADARFLEWFGVLFLASAVARAVSAMLLGLQSDVGEPPASLVPPTQMFRRLATRGDGRFIACLLLSQAAIQIAQPSFVPFLRSGRDLSHTGVLVLVALACLAKAFAQPVLGVIARKQGPLSLLVLGTLGVAPLPVLWLASDDFSYLVAIQVFGGAATGAFELASLLLVFDATNEHDRASLWAYFNLGNAAAMACGSALGALTLAPRAGAGSDLPVAAFVLTFLLSAAMRVAALAALWHSRALISRPERAPS